MKIRHQMNKFQNPLRCHVFTERSQNQSKLQKLGPRLARRLFMFQGQTKTALYSCNVILSIFYCLNHSAQRFFYPISVLSCTEPTNFTEMSRCLCSLYICPVWLARPVSAKMERTSSQKWFRTESGPAHGSEPLSSPALVGQSTGVRRVVAGKNVHARLGPDLPFKLARTSSIRPARPNICGTNLIRCSTQNNLSGYCFQFLLCVDVRLWPSFSKVHSRSFSLPHRTRRTDEAIHVFHIV